MASIFRRESLKHWMAIEALPIVAIVTVVVSGGSWALYRSALGPTIQWTKANPTPWNDIKSTQNTKIYDPKGHFPERWSREKL
ncbi:nadh dehydrogenase 1 alpha subcomplex [Moniliophthora roreri MCA 2997]|uniref:Nadh dehydrogenase 1 alpha subcomplex n=2 Tax=Moniliophthora roreri TaxID=221103 RepID=V2YPF7_MONRO|nr:nadh dehydrogenase 1 alpha subcomplex [Moniliophthora roreri MCA 2997]